MELQDYSGAMASAIGIEMCANAEGTLSTIRRTTAKAAKVVSGALASYEGLEQVVQRSADSATQARDVLDKLSKLVSA